jgi:hypothetical protein
MVRAILEGRKTQTRRVVKGVHPTFDFMGVDPLGGFEFERFLEAAEKTQHITLSCPFGQPGDRLWVREKWKEADGYESQKLNKNGNPKVPTLMCPVLYAADFPQGRHRKGRFRYPTSMPRWASRLTLEIVSVRVERVQEISRGDAMDEGCPFPNMAKGDDPRYWFAALCDSIYIARGFGWEKNPWVWVIEFRRITPRSAAS